MDFFIIFPGKKEVAFVPKECRITLALLRFQLFATSQALLRVPAKEGTVYRSVPYLRNPRPCLAFARKRKDTANAREEKAAFFATEREKKAKQLCMGERTDQK